jgi:2-polyprenyl-3-methyl-5-hydroxy-6-metoxy-1,4-benzoquinol methylase
MDLISEDTRQAVTRARTGARPPLDEEAWEERYRSSTAVWSGRPNAQLVAEASGPRPGTALDVGSGEGGDAIWLASRGWSVTAVDFSTTALERGAGHAQELGTDVAGRISWVHQDLTASSPEGPFDLVTAHFMHLPTEPRDALYARLAAAVAPGGTLLIVGHHPSDADVVPRPAMPELFFTADEIAETLDPSQWEAVVAEARPRTAKHPEGHEVVIHDTVLRARRRA